MKKILKTTKAVIFETLEYYYHILSSYDSLNIESIDSEHKKRIIINDFYETLYCVEIAGAGESINYLASTLIDSLSSDFAEDEKGELTWVLLKDGLLKRNLIFTRNKEIAEQIQKSVNSKILTFDEIINRLISLFFGNEYSINWLNRDLEQMYKINLYDEYKNPLNIVNSQLRERAYKNYKKVKFYQAVSYKNDLKETDMKFDIESFFKVNFSGALYTKITFNTKRILAELEHQKFNTMMQFDNSDKNRFKALQKSVKDENRLMINTTLQVYEDFGKNVSTAIGKCASCTFDLSTMQTKKLCNKTPLVETNREFSRIIARDFLYNYLAYNTKLDSDKPHLVGTNRDDTFINFGFKKATSLHSIPKAHTILLGTSGSGKTQAANDILKLLLGYDYKEKKIYHKNETKHIIFDIKDSFYGQVKRLQEDFPEMVDMNDFNKNDFLYNIVECDTKRTKNKELIVEESDLDFSSTLISLILASGGDISESLTTSESEEYKSILRNIYKENSYDRVPIVSIRESHPRDYAKLRDLGYAEFTPFDTIKEKEFQKFNAPLLHNVINKLEHKESDYRANNQRKNLETIESLIHKLKTIESMNIFSNFSKLDFNDKDIIYFRTDNIVGNDDYGYLIFAMQSILAKKTKKSQHKKRLKNQKRPLVFFWYEEARNIFSNELFKQKEVFERIINEWRSYDMVFYPVTQEPEHIPDNILNGFEIKMILTSGDDPEEKEDLIDNLSKRLAIGEQRKKMLHTLPKYTMQVLYGDGAFTMKFKDDEEFRNIVNT